ncbi:hypothetical protein CDD80_1981 [Ophiocordyceps camponoti-rufipedis]|uniref:Uncharacterized protein n=1 Tax=Ophiocordyceps camponoti-rufipedis TaxID=2004952 RepID=A0A2C5Z240_9HYPO|nr:hypothetical protein CDD80_1981 [Ophiocordyceps camponoti-rufipedis]
MAPPRKSERSNDENKERAYIAASRRSDRSIEARLQSAYMASTIHQKRTGRSLRINENVVRNEEMYEEEDRLPRHIVNSNQPELGHRFKEFDGTRGELSTLMKSSVEDLVKTDVDSAFAESFPWVKTASNPTGIYPLQVHQMTSQSPNPYCNWGPPPPSPYPVVCPQPRPLPNQFPVLLSPPLTSSNSYQSSSPEHKSPGLYLVNDPTPPSPNSFPRRTSMQQNTVQNSFPSPAACSPGMNSLYFPDSAPQSPQHVFAYSSLDTNPAARFSNTQVSNTQFSNTHVSNTQFSGSQISGSQFTCSQFPGSQFPSSQFSGTPNAQFSNQFLGTQQFPGSQQFSGPPTTQYASQFPLGFAAQPPPHPPAVRLYEPHAPNSPQAERPFCSLISFVPSSKSRIERSRNKAKNKAKGKPASRSAAGRAAARSAAATPAAATPPDDATPESAELSPADAPLDDAPLDDAPTATEPAAATPAAATPAAAEPDAAESLAGEPLFGLESDSWLSNFDEGMEEWIWGIKD